MNALAFPGHQLRYQNQPQSHWCHQQSLVVSSLYVDYIFLHTDERRRMAQNPPEYLIEQLQFTAMNRLVRRAKIKLNFNHLCKELVKAVQPDANVDYCARLTAVYRDITGLFGAQFNYTDALDVLQHALCHNPDAR